MKAHVTPDGGLVINRFGRDVEQHCPHAKHTMVQLLCGQIDTTVKNVPPETIDSKVFCGIACPLFHIEVRKIKSESDQMLECKAEIKLCCAEIVVEDLTVYKDCS